MPSTLKCNVEGLNSVSFIDKHKVINSDDVLKFTSLEFERLYFEKKPLKLKYDNVVLELHQKGLING